MKKWLMGLLCAVCIVVCLSAGANAAESIPYAVTGGNIYFDKTTGSITGCDDTVTKADIPAVIEGVSVTHIQYHAFFCCSSLESVTIPDSVIIIAENAFSGCTDLTSVTIPNSVTSIGSGAFWGCTGLRNVTISDSVTFIGNYVFADCSSLINITVDSENPFYVSLNGVVFSKDQKTLVIYPTGKKGVYNIPDTVTRIGNGAFYQCSGLPNVTIPNSVTVIEDSAFYKCDGLTNVTIPNSVTVIGEEAFNGCSALVNVTISDSITLIQMGVFSDCTGLTNVTIPNSVTAIGNYTFNGCTGLTSVTIPNSVTVIGSYAFNNCTGLTSVTIPNSVTAIGNYTFNGCTGLTSMTIPASVTSIGNYAFRNCTGLTSVMISNSVIYIREGAFSGCTGLKNIIIPNSVTSIGNYAFSRCSGLISVTISNRVTFIGQYMFSNCSSLTSVIIPNSITSIEVSAFSSCKSLTDIYYTGTALQWGQIRGNSNIPHDATVHYESLGPGKIALVSTSITKGQYRIHVVDENGKSLNGATVRWADSTSETDQRGNAYFPLSESGTPDIEVSLAGYTSWTNRGSSWTQNAERYSMIRLYPEGVGEYKLATAFYSESESMSSPLDLLAKTLTLNLKNPNVTIATVSSRDFYISCTANLTQNVQRYELWQGEQKISECSDGKFPLLSVDSFSKGGGCFIRAIGANGQSADTKINLTFTRNVAQKATGVSILKNKISITLSDDIPFLGGSSFNVGGIELLPVEIKATESNLCIGFNAKIWDSSDDSDSKTKEKFDKFKKQLQTVKKANATLGKRDSDLMNALMKMEPNFDLPGGSVRFNIIGYAETEWGSSTATGELYIVCKATTPTFGFTTWVVVVPVTVQISGYLEVKVGAKISYNWESSTFNGEIPLTLIVGLNAFGGVGVGDVIGVGAYGSANVAIDAQCFSSPFWKNVDLTGDLGLKAYVGPFEYQKSFAHNTWHLYSANNVQNAMIQNADIGTVWYMSLYNASQYYTADLRYLSAESAWLGSDSAALLDAEANTAFASLLTDTYRNAQPVIISSGDALYAAFIRAEQNSGSRYIVLTKFDGASWSEPVRADTEAILDNAPLLCTDDSGVIWLAYARTNADPGDSLLSYAQKQEIVVGRVNPETLEFTEKRAYPGNSYACMADLAIVNGTPVLVWLDADVTDDSSVLCPQSGTIRYTAFNSGSWSEAANLCTLSDPLDSLTLGMKDSQIAAAYLADGTIYCVTQDGTVTELARDVSGRVRYGVLPGMEQASFIWNESNSLKSSDGITVEAAGITAEYAIVNDSIYYSASTDNSANLVVVRYDRDRETWSLPIQLTDTERYLENLSVASLNGDDYILGMHTAVTISEESVEDAKNLVWSKVMPVSDLRLEDVEYEDENLIAGESVPVTLTVTNAGDHAVNRVEILLDGESVKTENCELISGTSVEIETAVICPETLSAYTLEVREPGQDDYTPANNQGELQIGHADTALELDYQQIGTQKSLMATVINQGIETASGSIVFYNADGTAVAESAFENLAAGDVAIAVYELDADFAGINGGDVSAAVTLNQEELYTYNNTDTLHIAEVTEIPASTEISAATFEGTSVHVQIFCADNVNAAAYCAFFNANGKMLNIAKRDLSAGQINHLQFEAGGNSPATAKIFVLDENTRPQCANRIVALT